MKSQSFQIAEISPVLLRPNVGVYRKPPRSKRNQESDYLERFDHHTLFYDLFEDYNGVVFSGPPLRNLLDIIKIANIELYGQEVHQKDAFADGWKTQRSKVTIPTEEIYYSNDSTFRIDVGKLSVKGKIQKNHSDVFKDRNVLVTLSKNNDLKWIEDWATYYARQHGIDAVLFYDNNSSKYSPNDILNVFKSIKEIKKAVVVPWNFKYGPGSGPNKEWDSNYCQYGVLEHAKRRYLRQSNVVVNVDIDELVVKENDISLVDGVLASKDGAIRFSGSWVETVQIDNQSERLPRFTDFKYKDIKKSKSLEKWAISPKRVDDKYQWQVHGFGGGFEPEISQDFVHRHYLGINTNWKYNRTSIVDYDPATHEVDQKLEAALQQAGFKNH